MGNVIAGASNRKIYPNEKMAPELGSRRKKTDLAAIIDARLRIVGG
jgi:hypothetical protein